MATLGDLLAAHTRAGDPALCESSDGTWVRCSACAHECLIPDDASGTCKVRVNHGGTLMVPWGYVSGAQSDPIEKKPFFHVEPGSRAFSFGMLGCDLKCACCQNWVTSQALRDPAAGSTITRTSPEELVHAAVRSGARSVVSTYNEPLITTEWAVAVFKAARAAGLLTGYVSNGHATPKVLDYLAPWIDMYKVDLKGFDELQYRNYGGHLEPVLETIRGLHARGIWVEVVTLVVPGLNNSDDELGQLGQRFFRASGARGSGIPNQGSPKRNRKSGQPAGLAGASPLETGAGMLNDRISGKAGLPGASSSTSPNGTIARSAAGKFISMSAALYAPPVSIRPGHA